MSKNISTHAIMRQKKYTIYLRQFIGGPSIRYNSVPRANNYRPPHIELIGKVDLQLKFDLF